MERGTWDVGRRGIRKTGGVADVSWPGRRCHLAVGQFALGPAKVS